MNQRQKIRPETVFILMPEEYQMAKSSEKFVDLKVIKTLDYPNGQPGFYFVSMRYSDNFDEILKQEKAARKALLDKKISLQDGSNAVVQYSRPDMGAIENLFDGDLASLMRSEEANPMRVSLSFDERRSVQGITVRIGGVPSQITVYLFSQDGSEPLKFEKIAKESPNPRNVTIDFGQAIDTSRLEVEILSSNDTEPAHVHVWEITLR
ncbi:MAG: hypothetical protein HGA86_05810 [Anaerolineaceae bacterium]|nr:hypothetical protein [Anaerolineaceae bacterium]